MLKVQLLRSVSSQSLLLLPKPFFSGHVGAQLGIWPRHAPFQKPNHHLCLPDNFPTNDESCCKPTNDALIGKSKFPPRFLFGVASSAYQSEGAPNEDGKGESNWDHFTHYYSGKIKDLSNGDVAVNAYHDYKDHIALMKETGLNAYRFSIAWSRIFPHGKTSKPNDKGVEYYKNLINELKSYDIKPFVTLFHWDVPQALEEDYGGFLSRQIIKDFRDYADFCFKTFGEDVRHWITLNDPWSFTTGGYVKGTFPPGRKDHDGKDPYIVGHNLLLAHAAAVDVYKKNYKATQQGQIGITLNHIRMIPYSDDNQYDAEAARRASDFTFGWFMEPLKTGEYPKRMKDCVKERLPVFYKDEPELLKGSYDFLGLNYSGANYTQDTCSVGPSYFCDSRCKLKTKKDRTCNGEAIHNGLRDTLVDIKETCNNPEIYVTENEMGEELHDGKRKEALMDKLKLVHSATKEDEVKVKGYFLSSFLDNFHWDRGYTVRSGIWFVDFKDKQLKRMKKNSAFWFENFLKN